MTDNTATARTTRRVFKYPIDPEAALNPSGVKISMPVGAEIVHVNAQNGQATMWAEVPDLDHDVSYNRIFHMVPTGGQIPGSWHALYLGTVHIDWTVWHIYEGVR